MKSKLDPDNTLTKRAQKWKKDQAIKSFEFEDLIKEVGNQELIAQQKVDGQSSILDFKNGEAKFGSLSGRVMWDFPLTEEIESLFKQEKITQAEIVGEMAGMEERKIIPFDETESLIKNPEADKDKIHWFPYQILSLNGEEIPDDFEIYKKTWPKLVALFKGRKHTHPVENYQGTTKDLEKAWKNLVEKEGNEGLVVRTPNNKIYKSRPKFTYDLVIVAVGTKKGKNWPKKMIGNVLAAFMDEDKVFRIAGEVGTGWNEEEKKELFSWAQKNKVGEDDTYVWVKPERIMEVQWGRSNTKQTPAYKYSRGKYEPVEKRTVGTIVKPRFIHYRKDKSVTPSDLRLTQIPNWKEKRACISRIIRKAFECTDKYEALGIPYPDPETMCHYCEGVGFIPIKKDDPEYQNEWREAEKESPADDGWHFITCPHCRGTRKKANGLNITWLKPDFKVEAEQYFTDRYTSTFLAGHGINFKNRGELFDFLNRGSFESISKEKLSENYDNLSLDKDFDFENRNSDNATIFKSLEEELQKNNCLRLQAPILIKASGTYFGYSGNKRCNLAFKHDIPVKFWVVPAHQAWKEVVPGKRRRMASSILMKMAAKPLNFDEFIQRHIDIMNEDPAPDEYFPPQRAYMLYEQYKQDLQKKENQNILHNYHKKKQADYPDHPDEIVISSKESMIGAGPIKEIDVWSYYEGIKRKVLPELKGKDLFIVVKPNGRPVYIRHPYDKKTEFIRISNENDFETYHSGRTIEYHVTGESTVDFYAVDFDPAGDNFEKAKTTAGEIADELKKVPEVRDIEIRYTGKRGFHIFGWLKSKKPIDQARENLQEWLTETFGGRDDLIVGESPKGSKSALGVAPMKINGGHVALYSMRVSGLCCVEVSRSKLSSFKKEEATPQKVYKKLTGKEFKPEIRGAAQRVLIAFERKTSGYDREEFKPGYKGKFVIQDHYATQHHWDLRLEFPVTSTTKSVEKYMKHRPEESPLPKAKTDSYNGVYRSWAVPKHSLPTKSKKIFIMPTEDHPMEYGNFEGTIPEGQYGAGEVKIWDKGTYELLDVEGDKKYVFDFHGKKISGPYAIVKFQNGYLWVKANEKEAGTIDYVQPTMSPDIWDLSEKPPHLRPEIRTTILRTLNNVLEKNGLKNSTQWLKGIVLSGSITGYNYKPDGDVDIDVLYDSSMLKNNHFKEKTDQEIYDELKKIVDQVNYEKVGNTPFTFSYMILEEGDWPSGDALYDVQKDRWLKPPIKIPQSFDPDEAFKIQKAAAVMIMKRVDYFIRVIGMTVDDLRKIDTYQQGGGLDAKKIVHLSQLKHLCDEIDKLHYQIWALQKDSKFEKEPIYYPSFSIGPNWDARMITFKYLARYGYHRPVHMLYERLEGDPYLKLIDKFIPD